MPYKYMPPPAGNVADTRRDLKAEFDRWNQQAGGDVVSDYDLPYTKDGNVEAEVVFILRGRKVPVKVSKWDSFPVNLRCAYLVIKEMRLAEARGVTEAMRQAFAALPAPKVQRDPWEVLGLRPGASRDEINAMHRIKSRALQGDDAGLIELNNARDEALARLAS